MHTYALTRVSACIWFRICMYLQFSKHTESKENVEFSETLQQENFQLSTNLNGLPNTPVMSVACLLVAGLQQLLAHAKLKPIKRYQ